MTEELKILYYCQLLKENNQYLYFDRSQGERYFLTQLYFPLQVGLGKYAFSSNKEQKEYAERRKENMAWDASAPMDNNVRINRRPLSDRLSLYSNNKGTSKLSNEMVNDVRETTELFPDTDENPEYLVLDQEQSRILLIANGGGGKTTILRRTALFYCDKLLSTESTNDDIQIENLYHLKGNLLPVFIRLRKVARNDYSIENMIFQSIENVTEDENGLAYNLDDLQKEFILLIDGLDEISDQQRVLFLDELHQYLEKKPNTRIILSTRVAGISDSHVCELLEQMHFRSRFIIPLTDEESEAYAMSWIDLTQKVGARRRELRHSVKVIFHNNQFSYLRDFIRTPLELLMILRQVSNHSTILNRYNVFSEMLREMFTNHVREFNKRDSVFKDHMNFLSYIAYHMQDTNTFYMSEREIDNLFSQQQIIGFRTEAFSQASNRFSDVLNVIASSYGIIDQTNIDGEVMYTFPIRSYQEFLSAYACCHICIDEQSGHPIPAQIVRAHMTDSLWQGTINFILSDLEDHGSPNLRILMKELFTKIQNLDLLTDITESNIRIDLENARALCESQFKVIRLSMKQRNLLIKCIQSRAGSEFIMALQSLFMHNPIYLEAYATALLLWDFEKDEQEAVRNAFNRLFDQQTMEVGACQLCLIARIYLHEEMPMYYDCVSETLYISLNAIRILHENTLESKKSIFVSAMTELMVSECPGYEQIKEYLDDELYQIVIDTMDENTSLVEKAYFEMDRKQNTEEYYYFRELFYTLGAFPDQITYPKAKPSITTLLMEKYFEVSEDEYRINQVAMAICLHHYYWEDDIFAQIWSQIICSGQPAIRIQKDKVSNRERNLFNIVKKAYIPYEVLDAQIRLKSLNTNITEPLFKVLFRFDDIFGAIQTCYELWKQDSSYAGYLGFLLQHSNMELYDLYPEEDISVKELLESGIEKKDTLCKIQLGLYYLQKSDIHSARKYIKSINREGWKEILSLYKDVLWEERRSYEGALVCGLAEKYGKIPIDDTELRRQWAKIDNVLLNNE